MKCSELILSITSTVTSIYLPDLTCNDEDYTVFDFSRFTLLEELEIRDDCFENVDTFNIDGLNELKSLKIGIDSFTLLKSNDRWDGDCANNPSRSFSILNCIELESIEIGLFSFSDYGGGFELNNLPKLSTVKIGDGSYSYNFYYSSFEIQGMINMILSMNRSS